MIETDRLILRPWLDTDAEVLSRYASDPDGGWALGCRIDGGQAEFVRVPYADKGLDRIPDSVTDEQALFVGDILATGFWAARISPSRPAVWTDATAPRFSRL